MNNKETDAHRLRVALGILATNLRGEGLDCLKPIGIDLANSLADFADNARLGVHDGRLDEAVEENPDA